MRWKNERQSGNVEDRRGMPTGLVLGGGGTILVVVIALLFGADPRQLLEQIGAGTETQATAPQAGAEADEQKQFISAVLASTEDVWRAQFTEMGREYRAPTLVLFTGRVESACGLASAAVGPFYCPEDARVYIDLEFYDQLERQIGAPGDFAQAYVVAHEVGHHVQNLLGVHEQVARMRQGMTEEESNALSVRVELQADFFAGVWAHDAQQMRQILEPGDLEEGLNAASAIGDDRLQRRTQGTVVPDAFTHGTSEQRVRWFRRGFESGDVSQGDTFRAPSL